MWGSFNLCFKCRGSVLFCCCSADDVFNKEGVIAKLNLIHTQWHYISAKAAKIFPCLFIVIQFVYNFVAELGLFY